MTEQSYLTALKIYSKYYLYKKDFDYLSWHMSYILCTIHCICQDTLNKKDMIKEYGYLLNLRFKKAYTLFDKQYITL